MESFNELKLSPKLAQSISELGFKAPTPIQAKTLPILLGEPTDFLGIAATGTGKTAAFAIPMIEKINPSLPRVQSLVLCPTRELAMQISGQINLMGKHMGVKAVPIYGGASYKDQIDGLRNGASVVVGTPGRVIDHMDRKTLKLNELTLVVLDEADEMISMGFKEELESILKRVPREQTNTWLFSATMDHGVRKVADQFLRSPEVVKSDTEMLSQTVEQIYFSTHETAKPEVLCKLIDSVDHFYGLVFCQTKSLVTDLTRYLSTRAYQVDCLHGDMDQSARDRVMASFREKKVKLLICTDVACRGLDVKDITHVINYSIPRELENYVHRIGRTARSGKSGIAMSLVNANQMGLIRKIEQMTSSKITPGKIPSRKDIAAKKITAALADFKNQPHFSRAIELLTDEWKQTLSQMTPEELAGRFISLLFPEEFTNYKNPAHAAMPGNSGQVVIRSGQPSKRKFEGDYRREEPRSYGGRDPRSARTRFRKRSQNKSRSAYTH